VSVITTHALFALKVQRKVRATVLLVLLPAEHLWIGRNHGRNRALQRYCMPSQAVWSLWDMCGVAELCDRWAVSSSVRSPGDLRLVGGCRPWRTEVLISSLGCQSEPQARERYFSARRYPLCPRHVRSVQAMFAEPTINDFLALIDWHTAKALDRANRAVNDVRGQASFHGRLNSGSAVINSVKAMRKEFDLGVESVLGELKRVIQTTKLDRDKLRESAVQRLTNFATAAKAIAQTPEASSMGMGEYLNKQFAEIDRHLQFSVRQFEVGFFDPAEPEIPPVANSITIGTMTGSAIMQGSPGAKQTVDITLNVQSITNALADFESAMSTAGLPAKTIDELMADVRTIRAQLAKPSPSRLIIQEAGKSLRNVVEGIAGGMLTPAAMTAAAALWSVLGLG
jgi:hypothetical protein